MKTERNGVVLHEIDHTVAIEGRVYCGTCAGPIEEGLVIRAGQAFCSLACSLATRPAQSAPPGELATEAHSEVQAEPA